MTELGTGMDSSTSISRRELGAGAAALGVVAATPLSEAAATEPQKGGHLRAASSDGSTADSLDPALETSNYITLLIAGYLNRLTEIDADGNIVPELASEWEASGDASEWIFALRPDVEFHNGKTLDADDVIATINYHRGDGSPSSVNALATQIVDITKDGDRTVRFSLSEPNADFAAFLSLPALGILPLIDGELQPTAGIGTGGYRIEDFDYGVVSHLSRNPNYFRSDRAHFDSVELQVIRDGVARQNALISGDVDVIDRVDPKTADLLVESDGIDLVEVVGRLHYTFPMRTDVAPFDNNDVRLALKYAANREQMLDLILRGHGSLGNDQPLSSDYFYYDSAIEQRAYDPDKAKFHLRQAGLDSLQVELSASEAIWTGAVDAVQAYRESAAPAGIDIVVDRVPNDGYWSDVWMQRPWCAAYWSGRPTEDLMLGQAYSSSSSWNDTYWHDEHFDSILKEARAELDPSKRAELYSEMQTMLRDHGGVVIPLFANHIDGKSTNIGRPEKVAGDRSLDGAKFMERWWFTSPQPA